MLLEKLNKKIDRFNQLSEIIQNIDLCNDIKGILAVSLDRALKALSSERGSIFLVGEDGQEMFLKLSYGLEPPLGEIKKRLGEGVIGTVAKERMPLLIKDIRKDTRFKPNGTYHNYKSNSFLCVPITSEDRLIGVISVTERATKKKPYTQEELEFLTVLSEHIALKIEKGQLLGEKAKLERELDISKRFASLGKFAGSIAHELNNPLDGVMRFVNLAFDCLGESEVSKEYLLEAKTGLSRMANVIRSLLELSRQKITQQKSIDVNVCIENALSSLRFQAIYNSVEIIKNFAEGLPRLNDLGLEQVFGNILKNALDAMPTGGRLTIESLQEEGFIKVAISDTGCGIPIDKIDDIFEPFFTTKEIDKGLGLGLTVCYEIVKQYNGRIEVESELGKGSIFKVYLPLGQ